MCHLGLITHATTAAVAEKLESPGRHGHRDVLSIAVTRGCIEALAPWRNPNFFSRGSPPGVGNLTRGGHNGRIDARLGSGVRGDASFGAVVRATDPMAHKPIGTGSSLF